MSSRDVTSNVRHFVPPLASAPSAVSGRAEACRGQGGRAGLEKCPSVHESPFYRLAGPSGILNDIGRGERVKLVIPIVIGS